MLSWASRSSFLLIQKFRIGRPNKKFWFAVFNLPINMRERKIIMI